MTPADSSDDQDPDFTDIRARLRRERLAERLRLPPELYERHCTAITRHLRDLLLPRLPGVIAFCWPIRNEVDCRPLVAELLAHGWRAAQPVAVTEQQPMLFRPWDVTTPMTKDRHGIPIPQGGDVVLPDVVLLPLVAFDAAGYRLGYGGGYFDRTLAALTPRPLSIGVGFELARVATVHPQPHDVRLDWIVTEAGAIKSS